ncbi:carbamoyltransferase N-terminal domain-containing protein [Actinosynnema sp. CS-041913]|uniref:carbamoyltransferase N-terminal domain-containing protein n=1 Tax=Actinosynnema sp. CS-041913 TaxID=3239917 RepID=UPI003D8C8E21
MLSPPPRSRHRAVETRNQVEETITLLVCGVKLTHDGGVALLDGQDVVFSVEMEKLDNNERYSTVEDLEVIPHILGEFGYRLADVDVVAVDGWETGSVRRRLGGREIEVPLAGYREQSTAADVCEPQVAGSLDFAGHPLPYRSYTHVAGHVAAAYCTSPFAADGAPALVLTWDGGMFPRLYEVRPGGRSVRPLGHVFPVIGHVYAAAGHHFGPFLDGRERTANGLYDQSVELSIAGKLMAYIALGAPSETALELIRESYAHHFESDSEVAREYRAEITGNGLIEERSMVYIHAFYEQIRKRARQHDISDEDVLASVHRFFQDLLVDRLAAKVESVKGAGGRWNLCFGGGCALNIKWNNALREHPLFADVWVPPFPNDSGSPIGAAASHLVHATGSTALRWNVRGGPRLAPAEPTGWRRDDCSVAELAAVLHDTGEPVVVLDGRAELGPRALGGRSIIAPAVRPAMKDRLNEMKGRAPYRPVAPICLAEHAPEVFDPGTSDPYMLFEHRVRPEWLDRVPAIAHLDGTARLQTVSVDDDATTYALLRHYHARSGIPVLCNTSANYNGSGFFPDVASAARWGRADRIWSRGVLYTKQEE